MTEIIANIDYLKWRKKVVVYDLWCMKTIWEFVRIWQFAFLLPSCACTSIFGFVYFDPSVFEQVICVNALQRWLSRKWFGVSFYCSVCFFDSLIVVCRFTFGMTPSWIQWREDWIYLCVIPIFQTVWISDLFFVIYFILFYIVFFLILLSVRLSACVCVCGWVGEWVGAWVGGWVPAWVGGCLRVCGLCVVLYSAFWVTAKIVLNRHMDKLLA